MSINWKQLKKNTKRINDLLAAKYDGVKISFIPIDGDDEFVQPLLSVTNTALLEEPTYSELKKDIGNMAELYGGGRPEFYLDQAIEPTEDLLNLFEQ